MAEPACQCRKHEFELCSRKIPHTEDHLSPCTTTTEPVLSSPGTATTEAHVPESPGSATRSLQWEAMPAPGEQPSLTATRKKPTQQ